ncbi:hypothetical protein Fluta_1421 [Fluviicola taffensis DSM 16823]|uniref:4'-phosphopantetheinyl transferase n=2 Tax=Fluviicola TaxID=332102 RepID=F2IDP2_FLUTR|nr:hypothetical protein Fluta_1421 [Fluviicola taffensis DSM 16823]
MISGTSRGMIHIINNSNSVVAYWKQADYQELLKGGAAKRLLEKKAVQYLLDALGYGHCEVKYKETGQPYLHNESAFLSISHSNGWFAVCVGSHPVGVDIQNHSPRLILGQDYFRNDQEVIFAEDEQALHLIWGAKEAFYKMKEGNIPDLKEEVSVLNIGEELIVLEFGFQNFELKYRLINSAFLVFMK